MKIDKVYKAYRKPINAIQKESKNKDINIDKDTNKSAKVEISKSAKELVKRISESKDTGFSERVEEIRKAVLEGNYKISSEKIADKILDSMESQEDLDK